MAAELSDPNAAPANQWQPAAPQFISVGGDAGWVVKSGNAIYEDIVANVGDTLHFAYSSFHHVRATLEALLSHPQNIGCTGPGSFDLCFLDKPYFELAWWAKTQC